MLEGKAFEPPTLPRDLRVAALHPWALAPRGAERTFFEIARALPSADMHFLHYRAAAVPPDIRGRITSTSFLQGWPWRRLPYRSLLPLLPMAVESLDLRRYDLVVSSSFGWTHGALTADTARHISYLHSPPRYLWDEAPPSRGARRAAPLLQPLLHYLRLWDVAAAARVDTFISNSRRTALRAQRRYRRASEVIHPPVDVARFASVRPRRGGHLVAIGELTPYKRFDLAVLAARRARCRLVVIGDGPERAHLERLAAGADVHFAGRVPDTEVLRLLEGARALIHPGVEDFGIVMVEALAAGLPVIAAASGGALEIVPEGGGVLVRKRTADAYTDAVAALDRLDVDPAMLRHYAASFGLARFRQRLLQAVHAALESPDAAD